MTAITKKTILALSFLGAFYFGNQSAGSTLVVGDNPPPLPMHYPSKECDAGSGICVGTQGPGCTQQCYRNKVLMPNSTVWQPGDVARCLDQN